MSKQLTVTTEDQLREGVQALWAKQKVFTWHWRQPARGTRLNAAAELRLNGRRFTFDVEFKLNPVARDVDALTRRQHRNLLLLIAPSISDTLAQHCRRQSVSCGDLNGRLWLQADGLFVERDPKNSHFRPPESTPDPFSAKSSRIVRALLNHRGREWTHKELVQQTGLSKGMVSRLTRRLVDEGFLKQSDRIFQVGRWDALLDAWAAQDDWQKRTSVHQYSLLTSDTDEIARQLVDTLPTGGPPVFSQWFAARLRQPYTVSPIVSAYVGASVANLVERKLKARRVIDGGVLWLLIPKDDGVFLDTQQVAGFTLACDVQIYLDLLHVGLRGPDQAQALREWDSFGGKA